MMKRILLITGLLLLATTVTVFAQNNWVKKAAFGGSKRARAIGFSIGTRGYLACGEDTADIVHNDLWEYDPGTDTWMQKASIPGSPRRDAAAFVVGNMAYVGTGMSAAESTLGTTLNDLWMYDPSNNSWTARANYPGTFGGIYFATGFAIGTKGYLCCGKFGSSTYSNALWEYNTATNTWLQRANFPGGVRYGAAAFVMNNKAYFGTGTDENVLCNDFYEYNPTTNTWTVKSQFPASARWSVNSFVIGNKGYFACGSDGGYKDEIWEYDPPSDSWTVRNPFDGGGRRSAVSFTINGVAYLGTGKGVTGKRRDFWQYYPYVTSTGENISDAPLITVAPNPVVEETKVTVDAATIQQHNDLVFVITDMQGRQVYTQQVNSDFVLQRNGLASGTYAYTLTGSGKILNSGRIIFN